MPRLPTARGLFRNIILDSHILSLLSPNHIRTRTLTKQGEKSSKNDLKWFARQLTLLGFLTAEALSFHSTLRTIKNDDPHINSHMTYKRGATKSDTDYVNKYDEDPNITLVFVRCGCFVHSFSQLS